MHSRLHEQLRQQHFAGTPSIRFFLDGRTRTASISPVKGPQVQSATSFSASFAKLACRTWPLQILTASTVWPSAGSASCSNLVTLLLTLERNGMISELHWHTCKCQGHICAHCTMRVALLTTSCRPTIQTSTDPSGTSSFELLSSQAKDGRTDKRGERYAR